MNDRGDVNASTSTTKHLLINHGWGKGVGRRRGGKRGAEEKGREREWGGEGEGEGVGKRRGGNGWGEMKGERGFGVGVEGEWWMKER